MDSSGKASGPIKRCLCIGYIIKIIIVYSEEKVLSVFIFSHKINNIILHMSLSNFLHELYYRNFTFTCSLRGE